MTHDQPSREGMLALGWAPVLSCGPLTTLKSDPLPVSRGIHAANPPHHPLASHALWLPLPFRGGAGGEGGRVRLTLSAPRPILSGTARERIVTCACDSIGVLSR